MPPTVVSATNLAGPWTDKEFPSTVLPVAERDAPTVQDCPAVKPCDIVADRETLMLESMMDPLAVEKGPVTNIDDPTDTALDNFAVECTLIELVRSVAPLTEMDPSIDASDRADIAPVNVLSPRTDSAASRATLPAMENPEYPVIVPYTARRSEIDAVPATRISDPN